MNLPTREQLLAEQDEVPVRVLSVTCLECGQAASRWPGEGRVVYPLIRTRGEVRAITGIVHQPPGAFVTPASECDGQMQFMIEAIDAPPLETSSGP